MEHEDFKHWVHKISDFLVQYRKDIENTQVSPDLTIGRITTELNNTIPHEGEEFGKIFKDFSNHILPAIVNWNHPKFFSYYASSNSYPSILGDMISATIGGVGFSWKSNPALTDLENVMADWYARLLKLPESFMYEESDKVGGGCYQVTATNALYNCFLAARYQALEKFCDKEDPECLYNYISKLVVYTSADAHVPIFKICRSEHVQLRVIPTDENGALTGKDFGDLLSEDINKELLPMMVVTTLGTYSKFAVDEITEIGKICEENGPIWLHVDASYGGSGLLLKRHESMLDGLHYADSIVANPSKWFQVAFDCTTLWLKNVEQYKKCFVINPAYLAHSIPNAIDFRHYGIALSRRFRSLKMWVTFRTYGRNGLERRIRKYIMYAKMFANLLDEDNNIHVIQQKYTFANFVLRDQGDKTNKAFLKYLNDSKQILLFPITLDGSFTLRFSVTYEHETTEHIKQAASFISESALKYMEKNDGSQGEQTQSDENVTQQNPDSDELYSPPVTNSEESDQKYFRD